MSSYNTLILHNGVLNSVVNTSDLTTNNTTSTLNIATAAYARYLKWSDGTETGNVTFIQGITTPTITFANAGISQTSSQIGYFKSFNGAIAGVSISNGSVSSPSFNSLTLGSGVWIISYYHNITCTASITFSQLVHGVNTSSTGSYTQATTQSSHVSETLASGNKYISGTYIQRNTTSITMYATITMTYTTAGTITVTLGMNAIRIA